MNLLRPMSAAFVIALLALALSGCLSTSEPAAGGADDATSKGSATGKAPANQARPVSDTL